MALSPEEIAKLLQEDAAQQATRSTGRGGKRGPRIDPTEPRTINIWFKQQHHICLPECEHREKSPTGKACWNPDCVDPRPTDDRGINAVALIKEHYMCRYCFLVGWLSPNA